MRVQQKRVFVQGVSNILLIPRVVLFIDALIFFSTHKVVLLDSHDGIVGPQIIRVGLFDGLVDPQSSFVCRISNWFFILESSSVIFSDGN